MKNTPCFATAILMLMMDSHNLRAQKIDLLNNHHLNTISRATNEIGDDAQFNEIKASKNQFSIIVNPELRPKNFVSSTEKYYLSQTNNIDTSIFSLIDKNWKTLSKSEKLMQMRKKQVEYKLNAQNIHLHNNGGGDKQLIYMVNNTPQDIAMQMQDGSFMGILEAHINETEWRAVQYWQFSWCGNSYMLKHIAPGTWVQFIAPAPTGNYRARLRYKILSNKQFYYSNEFDGNITYSDMLDSLHPANEKFTTFINYSHNL